MNKEQLSEFQLKAEQKSNEVHELRKKVSEAIYQFLMERGGGIIIICNREKGSWVGIEATEEKSFYVAFDNTTEIFDEDKLGDYDIFELNEFIINNY